MSHTFNSLIACPTLQDRIDNYFTNCPPGVVVNERTDFLEFLSSPLNRANILKQVISPGNGKIRTATLTYTPRILESEVGEDTTQVCTSTNEAGMSSQEYSMDITDGVEANEKLTLASIAEICEENESYMESRILALLDGAYRKLDTKMVTQSEALVGEFGPNEANVTDDVKTVKTEYSDTKLNPNLIGEVRYAAMNAGYCGGPIVFGWGNLIKYVWQNQAGCCADQGIDINEYLRAAGIVFLSDRRIETVYGSNHFISTAPGAMQMLYFNMFMGKKGINVVDDDSYKQTVLYYKGIPFDFFAKHDCGSIHMQVKLAAKLVGLPTDLYSVGDDYAGVTMVNEYVINNS